MSALSSPLAADDPLLVLFIADAAQNGALLCGGLAKLAANPVTDAQLVSELSAAAQSVKGAARIVGREAAAALADGLERALRRVEDSEQPITAEWSAAMLAGAKLLLDIGQLDPQNLDPWLQAHEDELQRAVEGMRAGRPATKVVRVPPVDRVPAPALPPIAAPDEAILALFRAESEACSATLSRGLVQLEGGGGEVLEELMRAAHSLKGAARVVGIPLATRVAHAVEECFVAAQRGELVPRASDVDTLLAAVDLLSELSQCTARGLNQWQEQRTPAATQLIARLEAIAHGEIEPTASDTPPGAQLTRPLIVIPPPLATNTKTEIEPAPSGRAASLSPRREDTDRVVKVAAASINRLMGLAGESLVESRRVQGLNGAMQQLKQRQAQLADLLEALRALPVLGTNPQARSLVGEASAKALECRTLLTQEIADMDAYARRADDLSERLYREAQKSRMRPFGDCVHGFPRMLRDVARSLGKQARLQVVGESTHVDRDVLESLDAPLNHLLRNALDHGLETPEDRASKGKPVDAVIRLEARHHAGLLRVTVSDDGRGIDPEAVRRRIIERGLLNQATAEELGVAELMEFIFLPGFSTAAAVTEISGRGVGLDAVRTAVEAASGTVRVTSELGRGTSFHLELPVTRSVVRAVVAAIDGEAYAFPLLRIERILRVPESEIRSLGNLQFFVLHEQNVALVGARQLLGFGAEPTRSTERSVVVLGSGKHRYGLVVDQFIGEHDLVVRPLDRRLGKVQDIAAAAILMDGSPALIFDTDDLVRSIERLARSGRIDQLASATVEGSAARKRILVVDDSITVREAERQLLVNHGYVVDVAVDGIDGWNSLRNASYDLVVSDVDMPRMNGLELVRTIRRDAKLAQLPIIIVSYKDRPEDRLSGLSAGANYYLTKSSFHDDTLVQAVDDLIGEANA